MSKMVERVARALCIEAGEDPDVQTPFNPNVNFQWQYYRKSARAAIEAMREPTADMIIPGVDPDIYVAMISAALDGNKHG